MLSQVRPYDLLRCPAMLLEPLVVPRQHRDELAVAARLDAAPVSYTHLTLPTILLV